MSKMIKEIKVSNIDKEKVLEHTCPKDPSLENMNFEGIVVNKPWGYEYLMFQNREVSIWLLYIKKGHSTSMHCHPNKRTSLLLISGNANCSTLNEKFELREKDSLIFNKGVFHKTEALSENGIFVLETETPSDKTDLFRLKDDYKRELKAYTEKKNITNKTYNYHYLFLDNQKDSTNIFGKYKFYLRKFSTTEQFLKEIKEDSADVAIVIEGEIFLPDRTIGKSDVVNINDLKKGKLISPSKLLLLYERKNSIKLSDYVISFLEKKRINNIFLVSGGNVMHLLESIRINKNMKYICTHHEQAAAMAAEGYSKMTNDLGFAMVTSGPGGTNAITGVAGAWMDSNPVLIISGQSYNSQTIGNSGLRQLGVQEINIVDIVRPITKYAVMVKNPNKIKYHLEKAIYLATHGRPGPVWIDIPINIQMAMIEEKDLDSFKISKEEEIKCSDLKEKVRETIELIKNSKRPIILLGNGVRLGKSEKEFYELIEKLPFPIVTSRNANDLIWEDNKLYVGRVGSFGQRYANFAIQNSDLLLSLGSRIALAVTGWAYKDFAREAKKIVVDIDPAELKKPIIKPDVPINCDIKKFILELLNQLKESDIPNISEWRERISYWKSKYPLPKDEEKENFVDIYSFIDQLSNELNDKDVVITDMGMSFQCTMQKFKLKKGQRLFSSSALASMGFGLPGAIGACVGNNKQRIICIAGDGGLQMNIQELQTVFHNKLPIKIFIINNKGYSSMRETQNAYFSGYIASESSSGVSMPNFIKIAEAYGLKTKKIENQKNLKEDLKEVLDYNGPIVCDINISDKQQVYPKQGNYVRPDGKPIPRPIEDMSPFMDREEFKKDMIIDTILFDTYKD